MTNYELKNLWFNKRTKEQGKQLKSLSEIFNRTWTFQGHFEDLFFGTCLWLFKETTMTEKENKVEQVKQINELDVWIDPEEEFIAIKFR